MANSRGSYTTQVTDRFRSAGRGEKFEIVPEQFIQPDVSRGFDFALSKIADAKLTRNIVSLAVNGDYRVADPPFERNVVPILKKICLTIPSFVARISPPGNGRRSARGLRSENSAQRGISRRKGGGRRGVTDVALLEIDDFDGTR